MEHGMQITVVRLLNTDVYIVAGVSSGSALRALPHRPVSSERPVEHATSGRFGGLCPLKCYDEDMEVFPITAFADILRSCLTRCGPREVLAFLSATQPVHLRESEALKPPH